MAFFIDLQCDPRDPEEQPVLDDTGDGFDGGGELGWIGDRSSGAIQDDPAVIGGPGSSRPIVHRPRLASNADAGQPLRGLRPTESDDLDRQRRARAESIDALLRGCYQDVIVT